MWQRRLAILSKSDSLSIRADELRVLARRSRETVLLAAIIGVLTGLLVRGFEWVVEELLHRATQAPPLLGAALPALGLIASAMILHIARASSASSDEYLRAYHDAEYILRPKLVIARLAAAIATLGSGGALGLEGPSLYSGSAVGAWIQRRLPKTLRLADHRMLLVAGAAAGVAAIFKAPATGAIFALEVPYRGDMARRMLLPALVAAATGYLTFVLLSTTTPLLSVASTGIHSFNVRDLGGALLIGVACALGARFFAKIIRSAKRISLQPLPLRLAISSMMLFVLYFVALQIVDEPPLSMGAGYEVFREWLYIEHKGLALWAIGAMFLLRCGASAATYAGGGVGGLFVPLVVGGGLTGRFVAEVVHPTKFPLFTVLGIAAFLGAGYRVPLAAVMFVAETTGRPDFVVPGLFAAVAAELVMGDHSITAYQRRSETVISS